MANTFEIVEDRERGFQRSLLPSADDFIEWKDSQNKEFLESSLIPTNIDLDFKNFKEFNEKRKAMMIDLVFKTLSSKS